MTDAPEVIEAMARAIFKPYTSKNAEGYSRFFATFDDLLAAAADDDGESAKHALCDLERDVRALLRAASAAGWRMVPVEATEEMLRVAHDKRFGLVALQWAAMLAAAPKVGGSDEVDEPV